MGKQTKSLGSLTDIQAPAPEPPDNRFDNLEKRIAQLETLLNDVMQQLDQPYRDQQLGNGKPKQTKPKQAKTQTSESIDPQSEKGTNTANATSIRRRKTSQRHSYHRISKPEPGQTLAWQETTNRNRGTLHYKQTARHQHHKTSSKNRTFYHHQRCGS